ncbi:MAG: hypothetical protein CM1200mP2_25840 [Planctomycetaceae bacterium]|nr:MAG: hypothetical protein CM1200mP2_25840 [Planctomycetaceae bacterium]
MSVLDRFRLDGKRLFITGGSRGLGREMSLACAEAGADVVLVGRNTESLETTAADIRERGQQAVTIIADVGQLDQCEDACQTALQEHGPIDILINNVGGRRIDIPTADMPLEEWKRILDLNLNSTFLCTKLIGGAMVARGSGGRVINIASISGMVVNRDIGGRSYETSKAAVIHFTRRPPPTGPLPRSPSTQSPPGGFMTEPNVKWAAENPAIITTFRDQIPAGDFGQPEDRGPLWPSTWPATRPVTSPGPRSSSTAVTRSGRQTLLEPRTSIDYPPGRLSPPVPGWPQQPDGKPISSLAAGSRPVFSASPCPSFWYSAGPWLRPSGGPGLHPSNVLHELRPHRLWRKNQNRPLTENAYFSVSPGSEGVLTRKSARPPPPGKQLVGNRQPE